MLYSWVEPGGFLLFFVVFKILKIPKIPQSSQNPQNMKEFAPGWRGRSVGGFSTSGRGNPVSAGTAGACSLPVESESGTRK